LVVAWYFLGESIQFPLRNHDEFVVHERGVEQNITHTILFAELVLLGRVSVMIFDNTIDKCVRAGACAREKGACVEFEAEELLVLYVHSL
jgi:hypothetical protein